MSDMINNNPPGALPPALPSRSGDAGIGGAATGTGPRGDSVSDERKTGAVVAGENPGVRQEGSGSADRERAEPVEASDLEPVVESINAYLQNSKRSLEFSVDDSSGRTVITVMDGDRDEIIRQIPPEQMLALAEHFENERDLGGTGFVDKA
ncbi:MULTISPECIES: flagellar protein FlaG [unclassified Thioalkalivibrio]|uniref:flagellar protein FlaG n=1 Tax=unclassified Thioalkalivibrio TaxID=2621013 RepID=UPI000D886D26|nr:MULTISPECIES: flagellar protein FlaG [unclassified Thioalkalivibrio]PYG03854.1 putative FlaG/YvyC family protein [Thioalkalivibrio sp. ALE21]